MTLLVADNRAGYLGVSLEPQSKKAKPDQARVSRCNETVYLSSFAT